MKLKGALLLIITLMSTSAFASKARLQALGQNENGSYYIKDTRNIFLNPAFLMETADFANFEWGATTRPNATPNAEGGFIQSHNEMKYGIQLGRETTMESNVVYANALNAGTTPNGFLVPQDTVELLLGGKSGEMNWGGSFIYQRSKDEDQAFPRKDAQGFELKGGISKDQFDGFARLNFLNKSDNDTSATTNEELEGTFGILAGGSFDLGSDQTLFGQVNWEDFEAKSNNNTYNYDIKFQEFGVGYARVMAREGNTSFFNSIAFSYSKKEGKDSVSNQKNKTENFSFPLTIGLETESTEWLTLRGSVSQNVLISQTKEGQDKSENQPNTTTVAAGVGVEFKKLTLDATFAGSSNGQINATNFLSNVGMTYTF